MIWHRTEGRGPASLRLPPARSAPKGPGGALERTKTSASASRTQGDLEVPPAATRCVRGERAVAHAPDLDV